MNALVNLAVAYAKEHDEELLSFAYRALKNAVLRWRHDRIAAEHALAEDDKRLADAYAAAEAAIALKPE